MNLRASVELRKGYGVANALLLLALGLRFVGLDKDLWFDEFASLRVAVLEGASTAALRAGDHPPLYFLLLHAWARLGSGLAFLRLPSVACGVGTVALLMVWLRPHGRRASWIAGLLGATLPAFLVASQEVRHYALLLLLTALSYLLASRLDDPRHPGWYLVGLAFSLALAVSTHLVAVFLLPSLLAYRAPWITDAWRQRHRGRLGGIFLAFLPALALFFYFERWYLLDTAKDGSWWMPPVSPSLWAKVVWTLAGGHEMAAPLVTAKDVSPWLAVAGGLVLALASLVLLSGLGGRRLDAKGWSLLASALIYGAALTVVSALVVPILWYRTALPSLVPLLGFAAQRWAGPPGTRLPRAHAYALALVVTWQAAGWATSSGSRPREPWMQAIVAAASAVPAGGTLRSCPDQVRPLVEWELANRAPRPVQRRFAGSAPAREGPLALLVRPGPEWGVEAASCRSLAARLRAERGSPVEEARFGPLELQVFRAGSAELDIASPAP